MRTTLPDNPHNRILTTKELCDLLCITRMTLSRWRKTRIGPPFYKVNNLVQYREADVMDWLESKKDQ